MNDFVQAMKKGVEIKDRKILLKTYPNSFVGSEAIDWMIHNLPLRDREEAIQLGTKLLEQGYIICCTETGKTTFKDTDKLYTFNDVTAESITASMKETSLDEPSVTLEDFEMLQTIGRGGFGKVMKVKRKDGDKIYAMKIMNKTKISGQRQLQCLIAEKNIMLNDNPFLVHLHYSFQTDDKLYFVMDYISGGDMAYHLERKGRFNEKEVRFFAAELVLAIEHLHSCGVIYRDLKLENILLDKDGHICLTDFGLSKELESISATTKTVCGTPTYLAPEILLGQPYGNSIDWWSLGVVIFELFTGTNPFDAHDFDTVLSNILHRAVVVPDYVPPAGKLLIEQLLQRNPQKRLCCGPTGSAEIQNHPFFEKLDWSKLAVKAKKAPFVPKGEENFDPNIDEGEPPEGKNDNARNLEIKDFTYEARPSSTKQ
eukprot:CAMPEP_0168566486 /NCGR_PEP_ID=MMETSP0413-20121227/14443_1 /TAXON_ID=136452 /ORGANISM="Filamoeba nolandi, Strain NC-AS-23-1" /LENGTH=426 /DNA_ID=CAMNT_0008598505 /DNA_START=272 /DNA_END=1550 /DNA_ORIENTATION=+